VCGEIAARPLEAVVLAALGYRSLSMPVTGIGPVKAALLNLDTQDLANVIAPYMSVESRLSSLREIVQDYCQKNAIPV
jgi:phosphotransferase system enzyme I (PtsP)